ncbi:MAG: hypothetical protein KC535_06070 [Nanoarchaeota archaeon]|nr:hypothetical protein [Nanoarchaeota archaeon]
MILFKLMGFFDILAGSMIILTIGDIPFRLVLGHSLYLMLKGYIFRGDLLSLIDAGIGIYGVFAIFLPISFISILAGTYLAIKGVYSLL